MLIVINNESLKVFCPFPVRVAIKIESADVGTLFFTLRLSQCRHIFVKNCSDNVRNDATEDSYSIIDQGSKIQYLNLLFQICSMTIPSDCQGYMIDIKYRFPCGADMKLW